MKTKKTIFMAALMMIVMASGIFAQSSKKASDAKSGASKSISSDKKILVAYFSATGTTKKMAEYAAKATGADLFEIKPSTPYTSADLDWSIKGSRAITEQNTASVRPSISGKMQNMEQYDVVFLAYPIWAGQAPKIISTFLESYDMSGKVIVPFCTSGSSGIGSSASNLHSLAPKAMWKEGRRFAGNTNSSTVSGWAKDEAK